jgi:hypothetical protein
MCEYSGKLMAWLDRETPAEEAAAVERHVSICTACRGQIVTYRRISDEVRAYCDVMEAKVRPVPDWRVLASGAAAAAAVALAFFAVLPRTGGKPQPSPALSAATAASLQRSEPVVQRTPGPRRIPARQAGPGVRLRNTRPRRFEAPAPPSDADWRLREPAIEITIPADAVFPPGAVPEGVSLNAGLTIAADGSAGWLWLRP